MRERINTCFIRILDCIMNTINIIYLYQWINCIVISISVSSGYVLHIHVVSIYLSVSAIDYRFVLMYSIVFYLCYTLVSYIIYSIGIQLVQYCISPSLRHTGNLSMRSKRKRKRKKGLHHTLPNANSNCISNIPCPRPVPPVIFKMRYREGGMRKRERQARVWERRNLL